MNCCMKRLKKIKQAALDTQLQEQDKECSWEAIPQMKHENVVSVLFPHEGWKGKDSWVSHLVMLSYVPLTYVRMLGGGPMYCMCVITGNH